MNTAKKDETFPEFWAGMAQRMLADGETAEVIARTTWHAAKCDNLRSAAPDMLAALKVAAKYFQDADFDEDDRHYAPILAAIAKAEGQS